MEEEIRLVCSRCWNPMQKHSRKKYEDATNIKSESIQSYYCPLCKKEILDRKFKGINYSDESVEKVLKLRREKVTIREISRRLGISKTTIVRWSKKFNGVIQ